MKQKHTFVPNPKTSTCTICERKLEEHEFQFIPGVDGENGKTERVNLDG